MLLFLGFALLAGAAFCVAEYATFSARQRADSLQRAATYGRFRRVATVQRPQFKDRVLNPAAESLAGFVLKLNPKTTAESRSEERRVGKECRSWWSPSHYKTRNRP